MPEAPERPLLRLPAAESDNPPERHGGGSLAYPSRERQRNRLGPTFKRLNDVVGDPERLLALRDDPTAIAPERAVVFEVVGSLLDFYQQAQNIGLEYLGDLEETFEPTEDFRDRKAPDKALSARLYLAMPDIRALHELLSLWNLYKDGKRMPAGRGEWRELFSHLHDVRAWGPQDRVTVDAVRVWQEDLARSPDEAVRIEIELWFHQLASRRAHAFERIEAEISRLGGHIIHQAIIPEIRYHAALVDLPPKHVKAILDHPDIGLGRVDDVMFLRPQAVTRYAIEEASGPTPGAMYEGGGPTPEIAGEPLAALLDGLPVQYHVRLRGRLRVDDPEDMDATYAVEKRAHGTEMASLIIHGDLNRQEVAIGRPLYVRPVLQPGPMDDERTPPDRLLVDVIYQAVRRIKEGDGEEAATAPAVAIINLSLGDETRPFAQVISPLARLLDYLAWRYKVLFLVSAGNVVEPLAVPGYATMTALEEAQPADREAAILQGLVSAQSYRTLLSPAESMNPLTIGAAHSGSAFSGTLPANMLDPLTDEALPNVISALGLGFRRAVKPDLLLAGGRVPVTFHETGAHLVVRPLRTGARRFGLRAAHPSPVGDLAYEDFTVGTSVATALATRDAHRVCEAVLDTYDDISHQYLGVVVKALLVHGADWGSKGEALDRSLSPQGQGKHHVRRESICRLLGYGVPSTERVLACTRERATLIGWDSLNAGAALVYRVPLPQTSALLTQAT